LTTLQKAVPVAAALAVVLVLAGLFAWRRPASPPAVTHPVTAPASPTQAPAAAPSATATAPDCQSPGAPPSPPDGTTSTAAAMKQGHDTVQTFVLQLEAYQACLNNLIDHAGPDISQQQKQIWLDQGNGAVDEANLLAKSFAYQIKVFHDSHPGQ
jgi:hypothetical protein